MRVLIVLGLAALPFLGCSSPDDPWRSRGDRVLGLDSDRAEDPVTGRIVVKKPAVKRAYKGTTYHFESSETARIFDRDPSLYAITENVPPADRPDQETR